MRFFREAVILFSTDRFSVLAMACFYHSISFIAIKFARFALQFAFRIICSVRGIHFLYIWLFFSLSVLENILFFLSSPFFYFCFLYEFFSYNAWVINAQFFNYDAQLKNSSIYLIHRHMKWSERLICNLYIYLKFISFIFIIISLWVMSWWGKERVT